MGITTNIKEVICEDGNIYQLEADGRWCRKAKFIGTIATYQILPSPVKKGLTPEEVYKYVYHGKDVEALQTPQETPPRNP